MIYYGWQITCIGMVAVFCFLSFLIACIASYSWIMQKFQTKEAPLNKVAASIAIALHKGGK